MSSQIGQSSSSLHALRAKRGILPFLGLVCGIGVSNIYYNQPLLLEISKSFHTTSARAGMVAVATQVGYSIGLLLFVPLGDVLERRALMSRLFACVAVSLAAAALAPYLWVLVAASAIIGLTASVTHIAVPIAPDLAEDSKRGSAIGIVMTGLLLGILLARAFSGGLATFMGWRTVFGIAAAMNAVFALLIFRLLPRLEPANPLPYLQALRSLFSIFRQYAVLRVASLQSALLFASFIGFWTTLAFLLGTPHFHLGPGATGMFGVIGATGAAIAPIAGKLSDRYGSRRVISLGIAFVVFAWTVLWAGRDHLIGLVLGCILLDMGAQCNQIANQTRVFGLEPGARSRLNTIYMTLYFLGASLGSYASTVAWAHHHWAGVTLLGFGFIGLTALVHLVSAATQTFVSKSV
jgi:predicted MFS family arabinose efflux permease